MRQADEPGRAMLPLQMAGRNCQALERVHSFGKAGWGGQLSFGLQRERRPGTSDFPGRRIAQWRSLNGALPEIAAFGSAS